MEKLIEKFYKEFCKLTNRSGGVLVHASIGEWHRFLASRLEELNSILLVPIIDHVIHQDTNEPIYTAWIEEFPNLRMSGYTPQVAVENLVNVFILFASKTPSVVRQTLISKNNNPNFDSIIISDKFGKRYKINVAA